MSWWFVQKGLPFLSLRYQPLSAQYLMNRFNVNAGSIKNIWELGEVILGNGPGRQNERDIILFESVGMPAWDTAATTWVYRWALQNKACTSFSLA